MNSTLMKGDELIHFSASKEQASAKDFLSDKIDVLIIHGFTSSSNYLEYLAESFSRNNFNVFLFNYNSYRGIRNAARSLFDLLEQFDELTDKSLSTKKITFVCHSMGGLVARALIQILSGIKFAKGVVTLGTPHDGTLQNSKLVEILIKWGETISGIMPHSSPNCASAMELTGKDKGNLIVTLNDKISDLSEFNFLTISGGKPFLQFSNSNWDLIINMRIQRELRSNVNDGLVGESSSKIDKKIKGIEHFNDYADFQDINHSYLIKNQFIALKIASWIKSINK